MNVDTTNALTPFSLEGERIRLVPLSEADVPALVAAGRDREILEWTSVPAGQSAEDARAWVAASADQWAAGTAMWAIHLREDDSTIGTFDLRDRGVAGREIGYWIAERARGNGYMTEAVRLAAAHAFTHLGAPRVFWKAYVGNWASWRTVWKCGFRREGIERHASGRAEHPDLWVASLLPGEPMEPATPWDGPGPGAALGPALDPSRPGGLVAQFHRVYSLPDLVAEGAAPSLRTDRLGMRMSLIREEFAELMGAVYGAEARARVEAATAEAVAGDDGTRDLVETADALADLVYVIYGMALECGIDLDRVLAEVQASNLSKLMPDGSVKLREDGKVLKGPGFFPPDVARALGLVEN